MKIYKYFIAILIITFVLSCRKSDSQSKLINQSVDDGLVAGESDLIIVTEAQFQSEKMKLVHLDSLSFPTYIKTTGVIDVPPSSKAVINTYMGGYIKNSPLLIGDKVKKGQVLATIKNLDFIELQQKYLEISEQLVYLKTEYERQKELFAEKISSKKSFLKAESDYKKTNAMHSGLRKKLQMLNIDLSSVEQGNFSSVITIYAPISGSITDVNVSTGTYVSPADKIMEIVNIEHIHLELKVFEKDVLKISKGQKVIFKIPESTNESFEGDIHLIGKSIGEDRTIQVHAHINHDIKQKFIVGMFVETDIVIEDKVSKGLPESAFVDIDDKKYVFILKSKENDNYTFVKKEVTIGEMYNGFIEIKGDSLFENDSSFLLGGFNLINE